MTALVERLRTSRGNASVLQAKLVKMRGHFDGAVFIFEGFEDVPVYEELIRKIPSCPVYEPLPAEGKKQVLNLLKIIDGTPLIDGVYFFVDRDFDPPAGHHPNLYELEAYSVENLICTPEVVESVLKDELRCAGSPETRTAAMTAFSKFLVELEDGLSEVNLMLFFARRTGRQVVRKPTRIGQVVCISLLEVNRCYNNIDELIQLDPACSTEELAAITGEYSTLHPDLRQRGKYKLEAFRKWLRELCNDAKSDYPQLFPEPKNSISDVSLCTMRRFAACISPPQSLVDFCAAAGVA